MRKTTLILVCAVCSGRLVARDRRPRSLLHRLPDSESTGFNNCRHLRPEVKQVQINAQDRVVKALRAFAVVLLACNPASGWQLTGAGGGCFCAAGQPLGFHGSSWSGVLQGQSVGGRAESATLQTKEPSVQCPELDQWREFEALRGGLSRESYKKFFAQRPWLIAQRGVQVLTSLNKAKSDWEKGNNSVANESNIEAKYVSGESIGRGAQLCNTLGSLGPVSVKMGQTLSQRPDIIGEEAAMALKKLQTSNVEFDNNLAWAVIKESLNWRGPIAPGVGILESDDPDAPPLFKSITEEPVAAASLGQVYKATTFEGIEVAVKVQRPDALAILAKDYVCFVTAEAAVPILRPGFDNGDISKVVDRVARDILNELDYRLEAKNAVRFEKSLDFLGFVTTPPVVPKYSSVKVLVTEWVKGQPLKKLPKEQSLQMMRMAVEACAASLVLTGYVHADPHEGNLMLADDGRIVFLDFGLMSEVEDNIMESFARGIQACLAEDWRALAVTFKETGFLNDPVQYKAPGSDVWGEFGVDASTGEDQGLTQFTKELGEAMLNTPGGTARFSSLSVVLNRKLSPRWKMFTPPYVLLLIRTFLTLEGIAEQVDPNFSIYEMSMPWAVRRSLSPSTREGIRVLRNTFLTEDNRVQWDRLLELMQDAQKSEDSDAPEAAAGAEEGQSQPTKAEAMNDAVSSLLGSPSGAALRRTLIDLDFTDLMARLVSKEARGLRQAAALALCGAISSRWQKRLAFSCSETPSAVTEALASDARRDTNKKAVVTSEEDAAIPLSDAALLLRRRQEKWKRKVLLLLVRTHLGRQLNHGFRGALALFRLFSLSVRIAARALFRFAREDLPMLLRRGRHGSGSAAPAPAPAT